MYFDAKVKSRALIPELSVAIGNQEGHSFVCQKQWWTRGKEAPLHLPHLCLTENSEDSSPMHTVLGLAHPHLHQQGQFYCTARARCLACSPECCIGWGVGIALPLLGPAIPSTPCAEGCGISPPPMPPRGRWGPTQTSHTHIHGTAHPFPVNTVNSTMLPTWSAGPTFSSV